MNEERILHEHVALKESHEAQTRGIVGWFYRTYVKSTREFLARHPGAHVLDVGCGEGILLRDLDCALVQMDISMNRLRKVHNLINQELVCAVGGYVSTMSSFKRLRNEEKFRLC